MGATSPGSHPLSSMALSSSASDLLKKPLFITAASIAAAPFAMHFERSSSLSINGVTELWYRDYVALFCGGLAIVLALIFAFTADAPKGLRAAAAAIVALLGVAQLARGVGLDRGASLTAKESKMPDLFADQHFAPPASCSDEVPQLCEESCEHGDGVACDRWGVANAKGIQDVKVDLDAAAAAFEKGCSLKVKNACKNGALLRMQRKETDKAEELAKQGCEVGSSEACNIAGVLLSQETGVGADISAIAAFGYFEKACDGDVAVGCRNAGHLLKKGTGVEKDLTKALAMYEKGCKLEDPDACNSAGFAYDHGRGAGESAEKAYDFFVKACQGKNPDGCFNQGFFLRKGRGRAKDAAAAAPLLARACELGHEDGCDELGLAAVVGEVPKDAALVKTFNAGCEAGAMTGCLQLGVRYRDGDGTDADEARAMELFTKVCDAKAEKADDGCAMRGMILAKTDPVAAKPLLTKACKGGYHLACNQLKQKKGKR